MTPTLLSKKADQAVFLVLAIALFLLPVLWGCDHKPEDRLNHVAILMAGPARQELVDGFKAGLAERGFTEGETLRFTVLNANNIKTRLEGLARQLAAEEPDIIAAAGGVEADAAKKVLTNSEGPPVLVLCTANLLKRKLVESRRQPGWNVTGIDSLNLELTAKRLELLKELLPEARTVLVLISAKANSPSRKAAQIAIQAGSGMGLSIISRQVSSAPEVRQLLADLTPGQVDAMLVLPAAEVVNAFNNIVLPETKRLGLPLFSHLRFMTEAGGLASYGPDYPDIGRQAARLAEKILAGTPAASMPFEATQLYEYTVNTQTMARLDIPMNDRLRSKVNTFVPEIPSATKQ